MLLKNHLQILNSKNEKIGKQKINKFVRKKLEINIY